MKKRSRQLKLSGAKKPSITPSPSAPSAPRERTSFPIVGIGASAGGLEAFIALLKHLPVDTGFAFVLVQHLDPQHESALPQILTRATSMPVHEVTNNLRVEPNHVYVIPPNTNMGIARGFLKLHPRETRRAPTRSIDFFFESLAQDQGERAIGVVLSGTASDGTVGLEAIKAEAGITFAQDHSAKYDSMPRNAVAAGCVDLVLNPQNIAKELARLAKHPYVAGQSPELPFPAAQDPDPAVGRQDDKASLPGRKPTRTEAKQEAPGEAKAPRAKAEENAFKKILLVLHNHGGVDFSLYRYTTIHRRITRRTVLNRQNTLEDYATFLRGNPKELDALYSDVLISVTSFFRNAEAFDILKGKVFSKLLQKRSDEPIRVWVLGCSTGQEAYSMAIAFMECADKFPRARKFQVFATDLNDTVLEKARQGLYAKTLAQDISSERLRRFFVEEEGGYRVIKALREMVVFARQNIISDPPFSRLDLISCRNLLIYLEPNLQKRVFPIFHYALKPGGILFLGSSESIGSFTDLFEPADKRHKIYSKKDGPTPGFALPAKNDRDRSKLPTHPEPPPPPDEPVDGLRGDLNAQREADRISVSQFVPPGVLVNAELQILQFRGPTSSYLQPPPTGKASLHLLKMAKEGLLLPLRAAFNKAKKENRTVRRENMPLQEGGKTRKVNIEVIPLKNLRERCFLILFHDAQKAEPTAIAQLPHAETPPSGAPQGARSISKKEKSSHIAALESELSETRDYLQSIQEQHDAATEELQASNEEVQSANEELQSINEELETSKEELESANEELTTVNEEMANRNTELNRLNADLNNLQNSTKLPILLLGRDLNIRRFSPTAEKLFNLIAGDVGRSIGNVRHNFFIRRTRTATQSTDAEEIVPFSVHDIAREVIDTVRDEKREVHDKEGRSYSLHVRPYMTLDNKVDGAVLVLMDITELLRLEAEMKKSERRYRRLFEEATDGILMLDPLTRKITEANPSIVAFLGYSRKQLIGKELWEIGLLKDETANREAFEQLKMSGSIRHENLPLQTKEGERLEVEFVGSLYRENGHEIIQCNVRDISQRREAEAASRQAQTQRASLLEAAVIGRTGELTEINKQLEAFVYSIAHDLRAPLRAMEGFSTMLLEEASQVLSEPGKSYANRINKAAQHMDALLTDLLDFSRMSQERVELHSVSLETVVESVLSSLKKDTQETNARVETIGPWPTVQAHEPTLGQVIFNLASNALKFTRPDVPPLLRLRAEEFGQFVRLWVEDNGIGIAPEYHEQVFRLFMRLHGEKYPGTGIGLAIVRTGITRMGGRVGLESSPGEGSRFWLELRKA